MKIPSFEKRLTKLSPWVSLVETAVESEGGGASVYHSLAQDDYVSALCMTSCGKIPLVRQFRPAIGGITLELPGGLVDSEDGHAAVIERELREEVGLVVGGALQYAGFLLPDTGRLENKAHVYFASGCVPAEGWRPEPGVERVDVTAEELLGMVSSGEFSHAIHVAGIFLAAKKFGIF